MPVEASGSSSPEHSASGVTHIRPAAFDVDDDDMDFEPATDGTETESHDYEEIESDSDGIHFHDAEEDLSNIEVEVELTEEGDGAAPGETDNDDGTATERGEETGRQGARRELLLTRNQILQLLGHVGFRQIYTQHAAARGFGPSNDEDDDEDDSDPSSTYGSGRRKRKPGTGRCMYPAVPSKAGKELMQSGTFGTNSRPDGSERIEGCLRRRKKMAYQTMMRELGLGGPGQQRNSNKFIAQVDHINMIPSSKADKIINYNARCYSGQFSDDGNFFFSCAQDYNVRMYDTSNPYAWRYYKQVHHPYGQWTITDASLSPDNRFLAYSTIGNIVCLAATDPSEESQPYALNIMDMGNREGHGYSRFGGVWSIRFSGDGRELVAGTSMGPVYVYDIEARKSILRLKGHTNDVNAVCFGDKASPHILYSGSDDTTLKVWDRRSMGDNREAGVFMGHVEGITYVDSKGDGRYILSNGKDQTMKLWDLRMMMSKEKADGINPEDYTTNFDYRYPPYDEKKYRPHGHDNSVVTFRGHMVLKTLIRCHFSPPNSTDSRYVYTGSSDGNVYVYNMDATLAGKIGVLEATRNTRSRDEAAEDTYGYEFFGGEGGHWSTCVRDASWHPSAPIIAATSWNGWGSQQGTCTVHSWNDGMDEDEGDPGMGKTLNAQLGEVNAPMNSGRSYFTRSRRARRAFLGDDDD
ncbi:MAG: hypothetical protein M1822_000905 [Bathelium mastoideum]|nr:MAG: hypothetical protein M1822_000905 [Bathelium mastoideum]